MNKKILTLIITGTLSVMALNSATACTRVFQNNNADYMISARNFDFFGPVDPTLVITPRGVARHGGEDPNTAKWQTQYGSVVIYADGVFPMDGMNEKGLAGHTLFYVDGVQVQKDNQDKPVLNSVAWLSYILDNFATVADAVESLKNDVRLMAKKEPIDYASDTKHIAIEDISGDSAIIEIDNGTVNIYHGKNYQVMTNTPDFPSQLKNAAKYKNATPDQVPGGLSPTDRFVRAGYDLANLPSPDNKQQAQGFILSVVNNTASPMSTLNDPEDDKLKADYAKYGKRPDQNKGNGTYWTTITDLSHAEYHFKSSFAASHVWIPLKDINFSAGQPILEIQHFNDYAQNGWEGNVLSKAKQN